MRVRVSGKENYKLSFNKIIIIITKNRRTGEVMRKGDRKKKKKKVREGEGHTASMKKLRVVQQWQVNK